MSRTYREDGLWLTSIRVVDADEYDDGPIDFGSEFRSGTLDSIIASLIEVRNSIPEEYRAGAMAHISATGSWGEYIASVGVRYVRPATAEEIATTGARERQELAKKEAAERTELAKLMAKYSPTN